MIEEVALFIDLENLRYSLLNIHGQEPNIRSLVEKAKAYGRPSVMRAYADFSEHPSELTRELLVTGVEAINIPTKRSTYKQAGRDVERIKNAADMVFALDAMIEALEADKVGKVKIFLLVTGDRDYVKLVTQLRNRFGQRVIIAGVPGSISGDLVQAAGEADPVQIAPSEPVEKSVLKGAIVSLVKKGPSPLKYWSLKTIDQWCQDVRHRIPGTAKDRRDAISELLAEGVLIRQEMEDEKKRRVTQTILDVQQARERGYLK